MQFVDVSRNIDASPSTVWSYLTSPKALVEADTGLERIDGEFELGQRFVLKADVADREFNIKVSAFEPNKLMIWESGIPLGLFKGVRRFSLTPNAQSTEFRMREEFTGLMLPLIWRSMPDLEPSFEQFADALKALSENTTS